MILDTPFNDLRPLFNPGHIMTMLARLSGVAFAAVVGLAACASSPDIPDNSNDSPKDYQSTQSDQASSSDSTSSSDAQPSSPRAQGKTTGSAELPEAVGPIAHVDDEPVPAEKFNTAMERLSKTGGIPPRYLKQMSGRLIDRLIDRRLVEDELAEADIEVTEEEIDRELESVKAEIAKLAEAQGQDDVSLETVIKEKGISKKELKDSLRQSIALRKYLTEKRDVSLPSDEEVRSFYENNAKKFTRPEQVHAHHILIRVKKGEGEKAWKAAKKKITALRKKITAGEMTFAEAAKSSSEGRFSERGGDMGFVSRDRLNKDFSEAAFSQKTGTISEPVKTTVGWHLIKITERKPSKQVPFEEVEDRLRRKLEEQAIKQGRDKLLSDLRDQARIEKHPDNIQ